jgi:tetratricopeptide (TPR) repeat protein
VNGNPRLLVIHYVNRYIFFEMKGISVREAVKMWVQCIPACALLMVVLLTGCSSGTHLAKENVPRDSSNSPARQRALSHLIAGSTLEAKGQYASAILEFQDALRYSQDPAIYFALSKNYSALSKHSLAIEAGKEAVRRSPNELTYRQNLADIYTAAFDFDAAAGEYEEIIKRDSTNLNAWFNLAHILQNKRPLRSLEVYQQVLDKFGPQWDVLLQVAQMYDKLGKFDKSAEALKQMTELDPENQPLKESLAQAYVRAGKLPEALAVYTQLREMNPDNLAVLAEMGGVHLAMKEYQKAADEFETILARDSVRIELKLRIGEIYFAETGKDSTLAPLTVKIFQRIAKTHPDDWRAFWFLGALGGMMHDDSLSVRNFRRVTELASWNPDAWVYMSGVFLGKNDFSEVARILEAALKVVPQDFRVNFFLGFAYSRLGRNIDAARVLERARQINPKDVDAIAQLALVYDGMKKYEDSDRLYEEALQLDSTRSLILNNYAYSLSERGLQLDRAYRMAKSAVDAEPDNPSYLDTMGWILFKLNRYKEAEEYVKKAISKGEVSAVVYEHLGDIYYQLDDKAQAMEHWQMALKLDESNSALREKISRGSL